MEGGKTRGSREERPNVTARLAVIFYPWDLSHTSAGKQFRKRITAREIGNFLILHESQTMCARVCVLVKLRTRNARFSIDARNWVTVSQ